MTAISFEAQLESARSGLMEAAAGLVSWTDAVANVARVCGGERAALTCRPLGLDPRIPSAAWQLDTSAFENDYLKSRRNADPWATSPRATKEKLLGAFDCETLCHDDELIASEAYNEFYKPNQIRRLYTIGVPALDIPDTPELALSVMRGHASERFGAETAHAARLLVPHVSAAVNLQIRSTIRTFCLIEGVLAEQDFPAALVDRHRRMIACNDRFERELTRLSGVRFIRGRLDLSAPLSALGTAIDRVFTGDGQPPPSAHSLPSQDGAARYFLLAKLPEPVRALWRVPCEAAILKIGSRPHSAGEVARLAAQAWGLTRAEMQVLTQLLGGADPSGIAQSMGKSLNTTRTQMKALFAKSGCSRQGELISLTHTLFGTFLRL